MHLAPRSSLNTKKLRARIEVEDAEPGSAVSVVHTHLAAVNDEAGDLPDEVAI